MINIEQIKITIDFIADVITKITKEKKKPLLGLVLSLGRLKGFKVKEVRAEIKDLTAEEKQLIIQYIVSKGFSIDKGKALIANYESDKKTTIFTLIRIFK